LAGKPVWVQPKNRSQAVNMVLLGADGAPLYPKDTHLHLTWPHNNMISSLLQDDLPGGLTAVSCSKSFHKLVFASNRSALCMTPSAPRTNVQHLICSSELPP